MSNAELNSSYVKAGKRFKGTLPSILPEIAAMSIEHNLKNTRHFDSSLRCVAIALDGSRLVEYGENKLKTHPFLKETYHDLKRMSIHAEADLVIKLLRRELTDGVTDVVVLRGTRRLLSSHPCSICYSLLRVYLRSVRLWWYDAETKGWRVKIIQ